CESKIDGDGGCAAAPLGIDDRKYFSAHTAALSAFLAGGEANECFEKSICRYWAFQELARARTHGCDDVLGLGQAANRENGRARQLLVENLDGAQGRLRIVKRNVENDNVGVFIVQSADYSIGRGQGEAAKSQYCPRHAGPLDQNLKNVSLLAVSRHHRNC